METQAIISGRDTDQVVKFEPLERLSPAVQELKENGSLWGVYYNEAGEIVAEDIWGEIHPAYAVD